MVPTDEPVARAGASRVWPTAPATQAAVFGAEAELYDAVRPEYPRAALERALGTRPLRVVDVGAGTGILTRLLVACGHDVVAVEPDERMLAVLARRSPDVTALVGRAEALPLDDASADAVVCGQAFHWFDRTTALPELHRVLRPGGVLVATWNVRDHRMPWAARLSAAVGELNADDLPGGWPFGPVDPWFTAPEAELVDHVRPTTARDVLDLVRTRSFWLTADDDERARVTARVHAVLAEPGVADADGSVAVPYRTCTFRMRARVLEPR